MPRLTVALDNSIKTKNKLLCKIYYIKQFLMKRHIKNTNVFLILQLKQLSEIIMMFYSELTKITLRKPGRLLKE